MRAKLAIGLKEYTTVKAQRELASLQSPDVEKTYVVRRTDTLSGIAEQAYGDLNHSTILPLDFRCATLITRADCRGLSKDYTGSS